MKIPAPATRLFSSVVFKLLLFFVLLFTFSYFTSGNVYANTDTVDRAAVMNSANYNTAADIPLNSHNGMQIIMIDFLSALSCQLSGIDPTNENNKCLGVDPSTGQIGFVEDGGGVLGMMGNLIDATFYPPISSTQYIAHLKSNFGLVKSAQAQSPPPNPCLNSSRGVGFCGLEPLIPLWTTMRNIVYLIFILVFVVIGIGIMLRVHIDPRTVMTVQNQIPKIIVGIIAITFSFAIAGFLIDIMWVAIYLFANVITSAAPPNTLTVQQSINITHANSPFDAAHIAYPGGIVDLAHNTSRAFADLIAEAFAFVDTGVLQDILRGLVFVAAFVVILIAIIVALFRLLIMLIITYINVILDVIFAPWWILAGLVPGSPLSLSSWFRDLIANLAVFPVAIGFFLLGSVLVQAYANNVGNIGGALTPPMMGSANPGAIAGLIGLGFIFMLPTLLKTVKAALKTPSMNFGNLFGPVQSSTGFIRRTPGRVMNIGERTRYASQVQGGWRDKFFAAAGNPLYRNPKGH